MLLDSPPDLGRDLLRVEHHMGGEVEDCDFGRCVVLRLSVFDPNYVPLLFLGNPESGRDDLMLGDAVQAIAHLGRLEDQQLLVDPSEARALLQDVEVDLPHLLGDLGSVARDLEDVEHHLEAHLGIVVYLFRYRIRLIGLDVGKSCHILSFLGS